MPTTDVNTTQDESIAIVPLDKPESLNNQGGNSGGGFFSFFSDLFTRPKPPESEGEEEEEGETDGDFENANKFRTSLNNNPSPIKAQKRDSKINELPSPNAITIMFLTGENKGKIFDSDEANGSFLGVSVSEVSEEQSAKWDEDSTDHIRSNMTFKGISPRTLDFSVTFYSGRYDVSHLVEQLYFMQTLTDKEEGGGDIDAVMSSGINIPPLLYIEQGDKIMAPCVCTSISSKYSSPFAGTKGFKQAEVSLKFSLLGGRGSPNMLATPLTSTPFNDQNLIQTKKERNSEGQQAIINRALGRSLGSLGKELLEEIIENREKTTDKKKVSALDPNTRFQLFTAGLLDEEAYPKEDAELDLALILAELEGGAIVGHRGRILAKALVKGLSLPEGEIPDNLPGDLIPIYRDLIDDYKKILDSVSAGITRDSKIFDPENASAYKRLERVAPRALLLKQSGVAEYIDGAKDIKESLTNANQNLKKMTIPELETALGVDSSQAKTIKKNQPYETKQDFMNIASRIDVGGEVNAYTMWDKLKNENLI